MNQFTGSSLYTTARGNEFEVIVPFGFGNLRRDINGSAPSRSVIKTAHHVQVVHIGLHSVIHEVVEQKYFACYRVHDHGWVGCRK